MIKDKIDWIKKYRKGITSWGLVLPLLSGFISHGIYSVTKASAHNKILSRQSEYNPDALRSLSKDTTINDLLARLTPEQRAARYNDLDVVSPTCDSYEGNLETTLSKYAQNLPEDCLEKLTLQERAYVDLIKKNPRLFAAADKVSEETGFDNLLLYAVLTKESGITLKYQKGKFEGDKGFNFRSNKNARGPGGNMKSVLSDYNKANPDSKFSFDDMYDYVKNLKVAAWNINRHLKKYDNKLHLALLAHLKGASGVDKIIKSAKTTDYLTIFKRADKTVKRGLKDYLPQRDYAGSIFGMWRKFNDVFKKLGFSYNILDETSQYLSNTKDFPSLKPHKSKGGFIDPYLNKPFGYDKEQLEKRLSIDTIDGKPVIAHLVKDGEIADVIRKKYENDVIIFKQLNKHVDISKIKPGTVLYALKQ